MLEDGGDLSRGLAAESGVVRLPSRRESQQPSEEVVGHKQCSTSEDVKKFSAVIFLVCSVRQSAFLSGPPIGETLCLAA